MDIKTLLAISGIIVGFIGYAPYLRDMFRGTTKPHFFSWFLWGILETMGFAAQLAKGGGAGAWVTGFSALVIYVIAAKAFFIKDKNITRSDWLCFAGAIAGIIAWQVTKDPTLSVIIITVTDALAFLPTYRKGFARPYEETLFEYVASSIKQTLGVLALSTYNIGTALYPASLIATNGIFALMVWLRRMKKI